MMNKIFFTVFFPVVMLLLMPLVSCAARINGALTNNGQADLQISAALEPRMAALLGALAAASGTEQQGRPILDGSAVTASMAAAPGIASVSLKNTTPVAVEGPVTIAKIGDFLASNKAAGIKTGFITFEQPSSVNGSAASGGRCAINLSLESGPVILGMISPDIGIYLEALMAPLATGEAMTRAEYLALVGSVYGKSIADEMAKAFINVSIDFPGTVQSVKGGTFSGRKAVFAIPLPEVLVLEKPLSYEVIWQ